MNTQQDREFLGFHKFRADTGAEFGSFEVYYEDGSDPLVKEGWYWWLCHRKCIAESDATGPFPTAEGAYLAAMEDGNDNARLLAEINMAPAIGGPGKGKTGKPLYKAENLLGYPDFDTALEEGTRYERAFGDGNDVGG